MFNINNLIICYLIVATTAFTVIASEGELPKLVAKLFGANQTELAPSVTVQLLKHLAQFDYQQIPKVLGSKKQISLLINAWDVDNANKCKPARWALLKNLLASSTGNMKTYLQFSRESYFLTCQKNLANKLKMASANLTRIQRENVVHFKDAALESDHSWSPNSYDVYLNKSQISFVAVRGALFDLAKKMGPIEEVYTSRDEFDRILEDLIKIPCAKVEVRISPIVAEIYREFPELTEKNNVLIKGFDQLVLDSITNTKVCHVIVKNWDALADEIYWTIQDQITEKRRQHDLEIAESQKKTQTDSGFSLFAWLLGIFFIGNFFG